MEKLYIHLKEASLSPIGDRKPSTKREFRASFVKRSKNQTVNDKLHHIRALNSTLKVHNTQTLLRFQIIWEYYCVDIKWINCISNFFFLFFLFLPQSKEADLQAIEQVLSDPELTSNKFREWKEANVPLMVEVCDSQKRAPEAVTAAASVTAAPVAETSL